MLQDFYGAVAELSFALLGFWWVAFGLHRHELTAAPDRRRLTHHVSLGFLLPGLVALASLLAVSSPVLWRLGFGLGGIVGAVATVRLLSATRWSPVPRGVWHTSTVVYGLFVVGAVLPPRVAIGRAEVRALTVEGLLLAVQLGIGAVVAWQVFTMAPEDGREAASPAGAPDGGS